MQWLNALHKTVSEGNACVLVTITAVKGSAPRRVGSRMLVGVDFIEDTIGGGALERQAIQKGRSLISEANSQQLIESQTSVLGSDLTQCCGGEVTLSYEYHPACALNVVVFGAGHVAQCVAKLLVELPCRAQFFDSRQEWLDKLSAGVPTNDRAVTNVLNPTLLPNNAFTTVEHCPDKAFYLVMTHSHELDFELVEAILSRGDSAYCGLIASKSKAAKFKSRLTRKGFTKPELKKLTAPIGSTQPIFVKQDNLPMQVAIAAVVEIIQIRDALSCASEQSVQAHSDITT